MWFSVTVSGEGLQGKSFNEYFEIPNRIVCILPTDKKRIFFQYPVEQRFYLFKK
jgi:hypothetical protein